jgi:hypothetical protein
MIPSRSLLFVSLLLVCASAAAEEVVAGREMPLSVTRQGVAATAETGYPKTASNGSVLAVAWSDARGGQFIRLDAAGRRIDASSIALPVRPFALFWRDDHWVVIASPAHTDGTIEPVQYVRIDANGQLLDRTPRDTNFRFDGGLAGVAWCGSAAIVVWIDAPRIYAQVLDGDLFPSGDPLFLGRAERYDGGMVSDGQSALLLFRDLDSAFDLRGVSFDRYGQVQQNDIVHHSDKYVESPFAMGSSSDGYIVVFPLEFRKTIYGGFTLDRDLNRRTVSSFGTNGEPSYYPPVLAREVSFDGTAYTAFFLVHGEETVVYATRLTTNGRILQSTVPVLSRKRDPSHTLQSAGIAGSTIVLYDAEIQNLGIPYRLLKARALPDGAEVDLPVGAFAQSHWAAAASATQSLVAWREKTSPITELDTVFATRVDDRGNALDPQSIPLAALSCPGKLAAASDGRDFLAVWDEPAGVSASIVRADGTTRPLRVRPADNCTASRLLAASNGSGYLVAWTVADAKKRGAFDVLAVRVAGDGMLLDGAPIVVADDADAPFFLASDGRDYLVVHGDRATRVGGDGAVLDRISMRLNAAPQQLWWNGDAYAILLYDDQTRGWRVRKIRSDGTGAYAFGEVPPRTIELPLSARILHGRPFRCDARGCAMAAAPHFSEWLAGTTTLPLRFTRIEDERASFVARELPIAGAEVLQFGDLFRHDCGLAGAATPVLVCARIAHEPPYSGVTRLFARPLFSGPRPRAVRH